MLRSYKRVDRIIGGGAVLCDTAPSLWHDVTSGPECHAQQMVGCSAHTAIDEWLLRVVI